METTTCQSESRQPESRQTAVDPLTRSASQLRGKLKTLRNMRDRGEISPSSFGRIEERAMAVLSSAKLQIKALEYEARRSSKISSEE